MSPTTKKIAIIALIAFLLSSGMNVGLWYMLGKGERDLRARNAERTERIARELELTTLEKVYEDTAADREELHRYVIGKEGVSDFLELIESTARDRGLTPKTRSVQEEKLEGVTQFESLALTLEVEGPYEGISAMLPLIESLPYQIEVRSVSLERTSAEVIDSSWRGIFMLRVVKEKKV